VSALAGICRWNQHPVSELEAAALANASRPVGPNGGGAVSPRQGLLLQAHVLHFDRLSEMEQQPWRFSQGSVLTWDGRLDNRDELILRLQRDLGSERTDAAVVAAAYARWGMDTLPMLVGDWSLALWDSAAQRLVLARDYMGARPLFYYERHDTIAWATCLDALVDAFGLADSPNETYIARLLTMGMPHDISPYKGVRLVPAGHAMVATQGQSKTKRYFTFSPVPIKYSRESDYIDRLRELLTEAVRVRLRKSGTVWAHLSGGWDSSSVVCLGHRLVAAGAVECQNLQAVSTVWSTAPEPDESAYIMAVERWCEIHSVRFEFEGYCTAAQRLTNDRRPLGWRGGGADTLVKRAGEQIVLTGFLGDVIMLNYNDAKLALLDHLYHGHPLRFLQQVAVSARSRDFAFLTTLKGLIRAAYGPPPALRPRVTSDLFTPAFSALVKERPVPDRPALDGFSRIKRPLAAALYLKCENMLDIFSAESDMWRTHPYSHRPLVEFMLAVPPLALWEPTRPRAGMRQALIDILPPEILTRTDKNNAATPWERARRRLAEELDVVKNTLGATNRWHMVKRGYVNPAALDAAQPTRVAHVPPLLELLAGIIDVEVWLRTLSTLPRKTERETPATADASGSAFAV
jgi:asparagine synthase (glutamine-hydrolysing)